MLLHSFLLVFCSTLLACSEHRASACEVVARTQAGPVCGCVIDNQLAAFRGVPYGEQPVGKRRFQELQPLKSWEGVLDATVEGPVCPQVDRLWLGLQNLTNMDEACIHANIYTPLSALPKCETNDEETDVTGKPGLPVLVFIHGGSWQAGSGNSDLYGPEYFVNRDIVMITFNYRQNIFGFMSLNTTDVPGNQGLRDILHLLRWVQDNVHFFGGNPDDVTLMGQSAGASSAHMMALSPIAKGLFKRVILSSGTALPSFFTSTPAYAQFVSGVMLKQLGIDGSDPQAAFKKLIDLPLATILSAYDIVQDATGINAFAPVEETQFEGVSTILSEDPVALMKKGALDVPVLLGFTSSECRSFQRRLESLNVIDLLKSNPTQLLSRNLLYALSNETVTKLAAEVKDRYFKDDITYEEYMNLCDDTLFLYPLIKLAQIQAQTGASDAFLYQFSYEGEFRPVVKAMNLDDFKGVAHVEDLNYVFRANKIISEYPPRATSTDDLMIASWVDTIVNFMKCSRPICGANADSWPPVSSKELAYQDIRGPGDFRLTPISEEQRQMINFFDKIGQIN